MDNKNRSRSANIGKYGLHLQLKNVPNGDHTYEIQLRDQAGNTKVIKRTFVIAVPTPVPTHSPTTRPTYNPRPQSIRPCTPRDAQAVHHADAHAHHHADAV